MNIFAKKIILLLILIPFFADAQYKFKLSFGGSDDEQGRDLLQLPSNEYILVGSASSSQFSNSDFYIIKTAENGLKLWEKKLGNNKLEFANSVISDNINNILVVSGFVSNEYTGYDGMILTLSTNGDSLQTFIKGRNAWDFIQSSVFSALDTSYLFAGISYNELTGIEEGWIFKMKPTGETVWEKFIADIGKSIKLNSISVTQNNEIIIGGETKNLSSNNIDYYYSRLTADGDFIWQKNIDFGNDEGCKQIIESHSGELFSIGYTNSRGGGGYDYLIARCYSNGDTTSCYTLGAYDNEIGMTLSEKKDFSKVHIGETSGPGYHQIFAANYTDDFIYLNQTSFVAAEANPNISNYETTPYKCIATSDTGCAIIATQKFLLESTSNILFIKTDQYLNSITNIKKIRATDNLKFENPFNQNIKFNSIVTKIQVYNSIGMLVKSAVNVNVLDTSDISSGIYLITIEKDNKSLFFKGLKN